MFIRMSKDCLTKGGQSMPMCPYSARSHVTLCETSLLSLQYVSESQHASDTHVSRLYMPTPRKNLLIGYKPSQKIQFSDNFVLFVVS